MLKITDNEFNRLVSFMRERYGINLSHKRTLIEGRLGNMLFGEDSRTMTSILTAV